MKRTLIGFALLAGLAGPVLAQVPADPVVTAPKFSV